jgi:hypothetical protein
MKSAVVFIAVILVSLIVALIGFFFVFLFNRGRRNKVEAIARANGWNFVPTMGKRGPFGNDPSIPRRKLVNVVIRKEPGCTILFFDYIAGRYGGSRVVTISEVIGFPPFTITPRGKFRFGMKPEIAFPSAPEFSAAVKVHSSFEHDVRRILTPLVLMHLGKCGRFWLDASGRSYFSEIMVGGRIPTNSITHLLDQHAYIHWSLMERE